MAIPRTLVYCMMEHRDVKHEANADIIGSLPMKMERVATAMFHNNELGNILCSQDSGGGWICVEKLLQQLWIQSTFRFPVLVQSFYRQSPKALCKLSGLGARQETGLRPLLGVLSLRFPTGARPMRSNKSTTLLCSRKTTR